MGVDLFELRGEVDVARAARRVARPTLRSRAGLPRSGTCPWGGASSCAQRFVYEWDEVGQLARARRWDYAGNTIPASEPVYPNIPTSTPTVDLAFLYSGGQRVLKSATLQGTTTTHTLEILGSLRLEGTTFDGATDDYVRDRFTERVFLAGIGRVVYDANGALPSPSGTNQHVYLQMGDHLGSTSVTIDGETGEVVERTTFQAMGGVEGDYRPARWGAFREEYKFTGKEEDTEIGLVYFGARYYHPKLGRFASADPLTIHAAGADLNPYAYVGGRVMNSVDPFGLDSCTAKSSSGGKDGTEVTMTYPCDPPRASQERAASGSDRAGAAAQQARTFAERAAAQVQSQARQAANRANQAVRAPIAVPKTGRHFRVLEVWKHTYNLATWGPLQWVGGIPKAEVQSDDKDVSKYMPLAASIVAGVAAGAAAGPRAAQAAASEAGAAGGAAGAEADAFITLYHGTDVASAESIVAGGINRAAARAAGGGDVFWATADKDVAALYARANPTGGAPAVVAQRIPTAVLRALTSGGRRAAVTVDRTGAYQVNDWKAFADAVVERVLVPLH